MTRTHGVRGDVLVALWSDRESRLAPGSVLTTERGRLTVESASRHQDRWIVRFREIPDRSAAEGWRGVVLQALVVDGEAGDELWVHELVGTAVVDASGTRVGRVVEVEANPASDLLVLDTGALVPVAFVIDHRPGQVTIDPPEGLLDL